MNVKEKGARGDGKTDDTVAIQAAIDAGGEVIVPAGVFMVNADKKRSLLLRTGTQIKFAPGAIIRAIPNNLESYAIVRIWEASRVLISGPGIIDGERRSHKGTTGEWGMGLWIGKGASNVEVYDVTVRDCWGDGIYVDGATTARLFRVKADNNRRQGLSVIDVDGLKVLQSIFSNTNGTRPSDGIDLEPDKDKRITNVEIADCQLLKNAGVGIEIAGKRGPVTKVVVRNCTYEGNRPMKVEDVKGAKLTGMTAGGSYSELYSKIFRTFGDYRYEPRAVQIP